MSYDHLTAEELLAIAAHRAWLSKPIIRTLAEHPAATPEVWLTLLDDGDVFAEYIVAELDGALAAPRVRDRLGKSDLPRVLSRLCEDATTSELRDLFPRLVRLNPDVALSLLKNAPEVADRLQPGTLVPLLTHGEVTVRKRALPYLARSAESDDPSDNW